MALFFPAIASPRSILPVMPGGTARSTDRIWFVNGINTTPEQQFETMKAIANRAGQPVIGIHNGTRNGVIDAGQAGLDTYNLGNNPATKTLRDALYAELKANNPVHIFAHSQGTIITNNALKEVAKSLKAEGLSFCEILSKLNRVKVETYGSPVKEFINGPSYIHYCNSGDPVCNFGLPALAAGVAAMVFAPVAIIGGVLIYSELTSNYGGNARLVSIPPFSIKPFDNHKVLEYITDRMNAYSFPPPPGCTAQLFLFDTSGSMAQGGKWEGELKALVELLERYGKSNKERRTFHHVSIMSFGGACSKSSNQTLFDFTTDVEGVAKSLPSALPKPAGSTPLMLSSEVAFDKLDEFSSRNPWIDTWGLTLVSDGEDTCGDVSGAVRPNNVWGYGGRSAGGSALLSKVPKNMKIDSVGYDLAPGSKGERDLQYMAHVTGGKYYNAADPRQLRRAIQRLTESYSPRIVALNEAQSPKFAAALDKAGEALQKKRAPEALKFYRELEADFRREGISSPELYFNLAQALEANDRYKGAAEYYGLYLKNSPQAADRAVVEQRIATLKQDYRDQFEYYLKIIESDLAYLKDYYKDLYNKNTNLLAAEFAGFVTEKGEFYTNLQDVLEVRAKWLENDSKDLSDSLYNLSDRIDKPSFDRDAVSLLTLPISQLEEILELLKKDKTKFMDI